jgi:hypothetical protein
MEKNSRATGSFGYGGFRRRRVVRNTDARGTRTYGIVSTRQVFKQKKLRNVQK